MNRPIRRWRRSAALDAAARPAADADGAWHARSGAPAITEADLDTLTADAMLARGMRGRNPRVNGERDIRALYASVL